jgi:hypothetical protein
MHALAHVASIHFQGGNYALAAEKGALLWKAFGMMSQGCVLTLTEQASDAVQITAGEIALMSPELDAAKAEAYLGRALAVAEHGSAVARSR